ncbi:hypothetical protein ABGT15_04225 [Flavobacterium enshiense]|uniref:hypothetical protein n=1 Tax=Flavobacterium enshiense TaxID=1341165 RepID=UPI00345C6B00
MNNVNVGLQYNDGLGDKLRDAFIIVNDNFTDIQSQVDNLSVEVTIGDVNGLQTILDNLQSEIDTLQISDISGLTASLGSITNNITSLQTSITNLVNSDITLQDSINSINTSIDTINTSIITINDTITDIISILDNLSGGGGGTLQEMQDNNTLSATWSYGEMNLGGEYYSGMKQFKFSSRGDGNDFSVDRSVNINVNPEESIGFSMTDTSVSSTISISPYSVDISSSDSSTGNSISIDPSTTTFYKKINSNEGLSGINTTSEFRLGTINYDTLREFFFKVNGDDNNYSSNIRYEARIDMDSAISIYAIDDDNNTSAALNVYTGAIYNYVSNGGSSNTLQILSTETNSSKKINSTQGIFGQYSTGNNFGLCSAWNGYEQYRQFYFNYKGDGNLFPSSDNFSMRMNNQEGLVYTSYINNGSNQGNVYIKGGVTLQAVGSGGILTNIELNSSSGLTQILSRTGITSTQRKTEYNFKSTGILIDYKIGTASVGSITNILSPTASGTTDVYLPSESGTLVVQKYKSYVAVINQSGTSAPTATIMENTLGGNITWTYNGVGYYEGTLSGAFPNYFKFYSNTSLQQYGGAWAYVDRGDTNTISLATGVGSTAQNGIASDRSLRIEIRVYN